MNLTNINGLGEKSEKLLNNLGIHTINDLLEYYPYNYIEYKYSSINKIEDNTEVMLFATVISNPILRYVKSKLNILSFRCISEEKMFNVVIYNRAFYKTNIQISKAITLIGKFDSKKNTFIANNVLFEKKINGSLEAKYHLTKGITNKQITKYIENALKLKIVPIDYIPEYYIKEYKFNDKIDSINNIHKPKNMDETKKSRIRLVYEELFIFMYKINYLKYSKTKESNKLSKNIDINKLKDFINSIPFELTIDQTHAVEDVYKDLKSTSRMNRLICGDVGSGKTIVAFISMYATFLSGYQSALMAPTEILATQHYENAKKLFKNTNVRIELLLGSTKNKKEIYEKLQKNEIDILIGTHAIISEKTTFNNLGLVITDEQHRFGVNQRNSLRNKGLLPDILYMSATPIPRTYALTIYGDMDISLIKTKPKGRIPIKTIIKDETDLKEILFLMLEEIKKGYQIYVVTPLIEESESCNLTNAIELSEKLDIAFNRKIPIGLLHGKVDKKEKDTIMKSFNEGKIKILVSTTVIEVGVDNPNATMMVIFDANMFGLSSLHQLRGRIGRGNIQSTCILIGNESNKRLEVLKDSEDGFYITEKDFEMRKEGDLFGVKQSGDMSFKIANIHNDMKILMQAKVDSEKFLQENIRNNFKNQEKYIKIINEIKSLD